MWKGSGGCFIDRKSCGCCNKDFNDGGYCFDVVNSCGGCSKDVEDDDGCFVNCWGFDNRGDIYGIEDGGRGFVKEVEGIDGRVIDKDDVGLVFGLFRVNLL